MERGKTSYQLANAAPARSVWIGIGCGSSTRNGRSSASSISAAVSGESSASRWASSVFLPFSTLPSAVASFFFLTRAAALAISAAPSCSSSDVFTPALCLAESS